MDWTNVARTLGIAVVGWLVLSVIASAAIGRWLRMQRESDVRDELKRMRAERRMAWARARSRSESA